MRGSFAPVWTSLILALCSAAPAQESPQAGDGMTAAARPKIVVFQSKADASRIRCGADQLTFELRRGRKTEAWVALFCPERANERRRRKVAEIKDIQGLSWDPDYKIYVFRRVNAHGVQVDRHELLDRDIKFEVVETFANGKRIFSITGAIINE